MFGKKEIDATIPQDKSTTIISFGSIIKGQVQSNGSLRLDGSVEGDVSVKARLVLGKTATILGNITANSLEIGGSVTGTIRVEELFVLKATAILNGDIYTSKLVIEDGAAFNGKCTMGKFEKTAPKSPAMVSEDPKPKLE